MTRRVALAVILFVATSFVGPIIRFATWPPGSSSWEDLLYELVSLLWPTQSFAVIEVTTGQPAALLVALMGNVLLFALVGAFVGVFSATQRRLFGSWLIVCVLVTVFALFGSGFDARFLNVIALGGAVAIYAAPFIAMRSFVAARDGRQ